MNGPDEALSTERFVLEPIRDIHADLMFDDLLDPRLYQYIPDEPPASREQLRRTYERWSKRRSADGSETWYNYALRRVERSAYVGTLQATLTANGEAMIAYQVFPRFWRAGVATECLSAMLRALAADGATRFIAHVDTRNLASQRLLEALGFLPGRRIENADFFKGSHSDEFVYERSASEMGSS
jgi:ribosomal-protein-alanine N-acetyltransferase